MAENKYPEETNFAFLKLWYKISYGSFIPGFWRWNVQKGKGDVNLQFNHKISIKKGENKLLSFAHT